MANGADLKMMMLKYLAKDCNKNSPLQVPAIKNEGVVGQVFNVPVIMIDK